MKVILNKGTPMEEVYTTEQINQMNLDELKTLKSKCQNAMGEIALKRSRYKNENEEDVNSKTFWTKMNNYKTAIAAHQRAVIYISELERKLKPTIATSDKEHWLWCYYQESLVMLSKETTDMLKELADERNGSHIEFEQVFKEIK